MPDSVIDARKSYQLGLLLVTTSAIAWSTAGLFTRLISVETGTMLVWRGLFGALGILVVLLALRGGRTWGDFRHMGWPGWIFAIVSAAGMLCFIFSLRITTAAHVSIIYATVPLVAAALAWVVMREKPSRRALLASLVALLGVTVMVGLGTEGNLFGDLLAFAMTLVMAVMMIISRHYQAIPIMPAACPSALLSGCAAIPISGSLAVGGHDLALLALFGLVNSALGLSLFALGARMLPAIETALIGALDAPLAPKWVWLFFAEIPCTATFVGGAIVFAAVFAHLLTENRSHRSP